MSNIFKLYPTHFSRGVEKFSRGALPPWFRAWSTVCFVWWSVRILLMLMRLVVNKYCRIKHDFSYPTLYSRKSLDISQNSMSSNIICFI